MTSYRRRKLQNKRATARSMLKRRYGTISNAHKELLKKTKGKCWICGEKITDIVTIDHIQPIALGGKNYWKNLMPAHKLCNEQRSEREEKRM